MKNLGQRIKELRQEKGVDQTEFAKWLGTSQTNVSRWENDKFEPDLETIVKIAQFFEVTTDYLLGVTEF